MGRRYSFKCSSCKYEVVTSGGFGGGKIVATKTFVCSDCKILEDIIVKKFRNFDDSPVVDSIIIKCHECGGQNLTEWDTEKKPCPKCGKKMKINPNGIVISWD
jgi:DNA-directed RNA polymerase subunit RPC12/RpoP